MSFFEKTYLLIVGVSLVVACLTFVFSERSKSVARREYVTNKWKRTIIMSVLEQKGEQGASLDDIRRLYLTEVTAYARFKLSKTELTEEEIRNIIYGLRENGMVRIAGNESYTLADFADSGAAESKEAASLFRDFVGEKKFDPSMMSSMMESMLKLISEERVVKNSIARVLTEGANQFTPEKLANKVSTETGIARESVAAVISSSIGKGLSVSAAGYVELIGFPATPSELLSGLLNVPHSTKE